MLLHGWMATADLNWVGAYARSGRAPATGCWPSTTAAMGAACGRSSRSGSPTAPPTRPPCCASSASAPRPSSATRWAARSPSSWRATIPTWSAASCSAAPPSTGRTRGRSARSRRWARSDWRCRWPRGRFWRAGFRRVGISDTRDAAWLQSELMRHSARDIAEAGRELGRFDSRPWLGHDRSRRSPCVDHHPGRPRARRASSASSPQAAGRARVRGRAQPPGGRRRRAELQPVAAAGASRRSAPGAQVKAA